MSPIRKEDLDVPVEVAMLFEHVVHVPDVLPVVGAVAPAVPAAGQQHRLVADLHHAARGVHPLVGRLAPATPAPRQVNVVQH